MTDYGGPLLPFTFSGVPDVGNDEMNGTHAAIPDTNQGQERIDNSSSTRDIEMEESYQPSLLSIMGMGVGAMVVAGLTLGVPLLDLTQQEADMGIGEVIDPQVSDCGNAIMETRDVQNRLDSVQVPVTPHPHVIELPQSNDPILWPISDRYYYDANPELIDLLTSFVDPRMLNVSRTRGCEISQLLHLQLAFHTPDEFTEQELGVKVSGAIGPNSEPHETSRSNSSKRKLPGDFAEASSTKQRKLKTRKLHKCYKINPSTGESCATVFTRPYDLFRHNHTIHESRRLQCPLCTEIKAFSRKDALTRNLRVVHPDQVLSPAMRDASETQAHSDNFTQTPRSTNIEVPRQTFVTRLTLCGPQPIIPNTQESLLSNIQGNTAVQVGSLMCSWCSKTFRLPSELIKHKRTIHEKPFVCSYQGCEMKYGTNKDLERHFTAKHLDQEEKDRLRFVCNQEDCKESFTRHDNWLRHVQKQHI